jgi:GH35 family endo-1,4-beta-xylanase
MSVKSWSVSAVMGALIGCSTGKTTVEMESNGSNGGSGSDTADEQEDDTASEPPPSGGDDTGGTGSDTGSTSPVDDTGGDAPDPEPTTLREAAETTGRRVGVALNGGAMGADPDYLEILIEEFGGITPENATKWGALQVDEATWNFSVADRMVDLAEDADIRVKGHTLVWHNQMPPWIDESLSVSELRDAMDVHAQTTLEHFGSRIPDWDVVNEAFEWDGSLRTSVYWLVFGPSYLSESFTRAALYAPEARLFYNDYSIEGVNQKSDAVFEMVEDFQEEGVPIDGVGLQMHLTHGRSPSRDDLKANMSRFGDLGLVVHVSEMDVQIRHLQGPESERLLAQAMTYYDVTAACVEVEACEQMGFWGYTDRYSWIDSWYGDDDPLLYDEDLVPKPARTAVFEALMGVSMTGCEDSRLVNGDFESGLDDWTTWGSTLTAVTEPVFSGATASLSTDREHDWQGPVQSVLDRIGDGLQYQGEAWIRLGNADSADMKMTLYWEDDDGEHWSTIATGVASLDDWTLLSGIVDWREEQTAGAIRQASLYIEGPDPGVDFYADAVTFRPVCPSPAEPVSR